jgi:hypothetical protein
MSPSEKKFANIHYPGMRANPDEGKRTLGAPVHWRFDPQIDCIGEPAHRALFEGSAFIMAASPLGVSLVRQLFNMGLGRVGMFGERPVSGAHAVVGEQTEIGVLAALSKWAKERAPWAEFERYGSASIDRSLDDMARGFNMIISVEGISGAQETVVLANTLGLDAIVANVIGRKAWVGLIPAKTICEDCLELPQFDEEKGMFFPLIEAVATRLALMAVELRMNRDAAIQSAKILELRDASQTPWKVEAIDMASKPGCEKCQALHAR